MSDFITLMPHIEQSLTFQILLTGKSVHIYDLLSITDYMCFTMVVILTCLKEDDILLVASLQF